MIMFIYWEMVTPESRNKILYIDSGFQVSQ
jgi:hypothetical protein